MRYDKFKKLKLNKQGFIPCFIIQTGEEGRIFEIDKNSGRVFVIAWRHGYAEKQQQWFNYTEIETW